MSPKTVRGPVVSTSAVPAPLTTEVPRKTKCDAWGPSPAYLPAQGSRALYSGSSTYTVQADDASDALACAVRPYLVGLDPSSVTLQIEWLDGDNQPGSRVKVSATLAYSHLITLVYRADDWTTIGTSSTMTIMH